MKNRQVILTSRPHGVPMAEHFDIVTTDVPELKAGEFLVKNEFLSVDPRHDLRVGAVGRPS